MWFLYAILSGLCAAFLAFAINLGLKHADALLMTCFFSIIMSCMLLITCIITKRFANFSLSSLTMREWLALFIAGLCAGLGYFAHFLSLKYGPISLVVAIDRLSIVYVVILSVVFLKYPLSVWKIIGSAVMVFGAYLISHI